MGLNRAFTYRYSRKTSIHMLGSCNSVFVLKFKGKIIRLAFEMLFTTVLIINDQNN